jgi:tetratricopeptide (TPR) repeat protein
LNIANGAYEDGYSAFVEANKLLPDNSLILNNMALCLFYTGKLREAIKILETFIFKNPTKQLNEGLLFNLCTLYELESAKAQQKKFNILLWLNMYVGDGFYEPSLKLN